MSPQPRSDVAKQRAEPPPTGGLPARARDWLPGRSDLTAELARFLGVERALLSCSGTAALVAALDALKARAPARRKVIIPAYTCPLVAIAVVHCGLEPILCDLLPDSFDLEPEQLEQLCNNATLAVVPTHFGGHVSDIATAVRIAHAQGAWVIEDAAQALGATIDGHSVGLTGDIGFFSLAVGKGMTLFEGGVLISRDEALLNACGQQLHQQQHPSRWSHKLGGLLWDGRRTAELIAYTLAYRPRLLNWAYAREVRRALAEGDLVAAAGDDFSRQIPLHRVGYLRRRAGSSALQRLPEWLSQCYQQAQQRLPLLRAIDGVTVLSDSPQAPAAQGTWPVVIVLLPNQAIRDWVLHRSWGKGLGTSLMFVHALPDYECYRDIFAAEEGEQAPNARRLAQRMLVISNSPWLDQPRFERLCAMLHRATSEARELPATA
ncbi:DegT/DnrJ/EryC1/StrS family aminotransferase [Carnimonas bestiolae]|uniref:DegT/DnrJ/EryC1/StrS family aminotransferase n=1 Tax=Carnimonas bestiolae TaxID=3402172 RepID=UPI003EDC4742